jgi:glyoxylase-like metal-dependent hydrolase (beta-lactamase superfamily II)
MLQLADEVWQIPLIPRSGINAYLLGDVLVDAGVKAHGGKIVRELEGRPVSAHAITHAHADHVGGTRHVQETLRVPVWVGAGDAGALRAGHPPAPPGRRGGSLLERYGSFPPAEPDRELREGDEVGPGFVVLDTPGHSPGHVSFWRERDRTLVCGDVFFNMSVVTTRVGLRQPPDLFTHDPALNRRSERRLADLDPALVLFGHGPALRDPARIRAFIDRLPPAGS